MDKINSSKMDLNADETYENGIPSSSCDLPDGVSIQINNTLCAFNMPLHIDLKRVALAVANADLNKARGFLLIQLREPHCVAKVFSSGRVTVHQCKNEAECRKAARRIGRMIQKSMGKLNERICLRDLSIRNMTATCRLPFGVKIEEFAQQHREAYYEPELFPGVVYRIKSPKATLRIHTTGTITITGATSETSLNECLKQIYPKLELYASKSRHGRTVAIQEKEVRKRSSAHRSDATNIKRPRERQTKETFVFSDDDDELSEYLDDEDF